jgi:hypothetical protein
VQNPYNIDAVILRPIEHNIPAHRKAAQLRRQFRPEAPRPWLDGEQLAWTIDIVEKIVGCLDVIHRNIEPDLIKILLGTDSFSDLRQELPLIAICFGGVEARAATALDCINVEPPGRAAFQAFLNIAPQLAQFRCLDLVLALHEAQRFAHDLACRTVMAGSHLLAHQCLKLRCEIDIHRHGRILRASLPTFTDRTTGNNCQFLPNMRRILALREFRDQAQLAVP